jgi:uncharacterized protein YkwD
MAARMGPPGHRAKIPGAFTEVGAGIAYDGQGVPYFCAVFGTPPGLS